MQPFINGAARVKWWGFPIGADGSCALFNGCISYEFNDNKL